MTFVSPVQNRIASAWRGVRGGDLSFFVKALAAAVVGTAMGLWLTNAVVHGAFPFGGFSVGPWIAYPTAGSPAIDPYARAILSVSGFAPIGSDEGVAFFADRDADGRRLNGSCEYLLESVDPAARFWSLSLFDPDGRVIDHPANRGAVTSQDVVRLERKVSIAVGSDAQPGNWLPAPSRGAFVLMLSLYEANSGTAAAAASDMILPTIRRGLCRR